MPGITSRNVHKRMKMYCTMNSRMTFPAKAKPSNSVTYGISSPRRMPRWYRDAPTLSTTPSSVHTIDTNHTAKAGNARCSARKLRSISNRRE